MGSAAAAIDRAWEASFLAGLSEPVGAELRASACEEELFRGQNVYREVAEPRYAFAALVVTGILKVYVTSRRGRRIVLRYVHPGGVLGLSSVICRGEPAGAEAVTKGSLLRLDPTTLMRLTRSDPATACVVAAELARRAVADDQLLEANLFGSVRVRLARHLLEVAEPRQGQRVARITRQELADSVGSVREVVGRILVEFERQDLVRREGATTVLADEDRLAEVASSYDEADS
jgi:CRP/FNR family transcriptional regulator, cyclic AMP receptor protein